MKIGILAGEPSGDLVGAGLIAALRECDSTLKVTGIGGPLMIKAGCQSLFDMERLSVMGLIDPLFRLPELFKIRRELYRYFIDHRPDVFIGIDAPDFNLGLELKLRQAGIPTIHYVSPSVWAWRKKRIHKIAKAVDLMLTLFPFEADFYKAHHVPVHFVGHPLADLIPLHSEKSIARKTLNIDTDGIYIALLPGSRKGELKYLAELFIETAIRCLKKNSKIKFITSAANTKRNQEFQTYCERFAPDLPITFFEGRSHEVMAAADVVLVTSGTATLETMLFKRPMVIAYRMSATTYQVARYLVKIPFIGLPNLLANEALVPEFIQDTATPDALSNALLDFIEHPEKTHALEKRFLEIHEQLRRNANREAAKAVLTLLGK